MKIDLYKNLFKLRKEILKITEADDIIIKPIDKLADLDVLLKYLK